MTLSARITTLMDYVSQAASIGTPNGYFVGDTKARSRTERDSKTRRLNMRTAESRLRAARTALDAGDPDMALLLTDEAERLVIEAKRNGTKIFAATETRGRATSDRNAKFADAVDAKLRLMGDVKHGDLIKTCRAVLADDIELSKRFWGQTPDGLLKAYYRGRDKGQQKRPCLLSRTGPKDV